MKTTLTPLALASVHVALLAGCPRPPEPGCGDSLIGSSEECDGDALGAATCTGLGFGGGTLACNPDCTLDTSACTPAPSCGDGTIDPGESCEGANLGGADCTTAGAFSGGMLACAADCTFDTSACLGLPSVPVLRLPWNGAYLGSVHAPGTLRPTFVWQASTVPGGAALSYELDYGTDATFAAGVTTVPTTFLSHQPAADLPVEAFTPPVGGRYWWRVRACAGAACSAYSPAWYVNAGRSDRDFNGDGYADVAVGAPYSGSFYMGAAYVYFGGPTGTDTTPDAAIPGVDCGDNYGQSIGSSDVNADGFADLLVGAPRVQAFFFPGGADVYMGGPGAFDTVPDATLAGATMNFDEFGVSIAGAGDVDGDGYADVIVGARLEAALGAAYIYRGGPGAGLDETADWTVAGTRSGGWFGLAVAAAGDVNDDGYADVVVGEPYDSFNPTPGNAYIWFGAAALPATPPDGTLTGVGDDDRFGQKLAGNVDVDGDGYGDVIVGAFYNDDGAVDGGAVYVYLGGAAAPFDPTADATLLGLAMDDYFGTGVGAAGDVNGDGFGDLVVGAPHADSGAMEAGRISVYFGGTGTFDTTSDGNSGGLVDFLLIGSSASGAGDVNGDGYDDVITGILGGGGGNGAVRVLHGGAGASFDGMLDATLVGEASGDYFGYAVW